MIGMLKRKFPCLAKCIQYQPSAVSNIIKACCFLWNFGLLSGDNIGFNPDEFVVPDQDDFDARLDPTSGGRMMRHQVCDYLWQHKH